MRRIIQFITEYRRPVTLLIALLVSVSLMLMGEGGQSRFARAVTTAIFNTGRFTLSWGIHMMDLWNENRRLRLQNLELSYQLSQNTVAARENERLRSLLGLKRKNSLEVRSATVIGRDMDRVVNTLIIDSGTVDGIQRNMACVTADGLVGRIHEVYPACSSVQIITDVNSRVSAYIPAYAPIRGDPKLIAESGRPAGSPVYGIVSWDGGKYLRMFGLPLINEVKPGDKVYTTGFGNVFPGGILIGVVGNEPIREVEIYASVNVIPAVDYSRVHELFVIRGSEHQGVWNDNSGGGHFQRYPNVSGAHVGDPRTNLQ
jgi:rod shape-determining protein MreC